MYMDRISPELIIDSSGFMNKGKVGKTEWINRKTEIAVFIDLSAPVEMTTKKRFGAMHHTILPAIHQRMGHNQLMPDVYPVNPFGERLL